jgi:cytoskeletal protein CcmA (bactofilin family)
MSVFCPHCNRRLRIENLRITRYFAVNELATTWDLMITRNGHLVAKAKVGNLTVLGKIQGAVRSPGRVIVRKSATVNADIEAPRLLVEGGAVMKGFLRIGATELREPARGEAASK